MKSAHHLGSALARWSHALPARLAQLRDGATQWVGPALAALPAANLTPPPRVLVVDDCAVNRLMVASALSVWGIVPMQAADGAEAVALAGGHRFGLILMDLDMPVLGGLAATEQIRRFEVDRSLQRASVVAYSSSPLGDDPALLRASGFDAALKKPCNLHALQACLTRWCGIDAAALAAASAHAESPSSHVRAMQ